MVAVRTLLRLLLVLCIVPRAMTETRSRQACGEGMDRWFGSFYNQNAQADARLRIGGWGDEYDTVLRFDLSGMPTTATEAAIFMYVRPGGNGFTGIDWYQYTGQWQSPSIAWGSQPGAVRLGSTSAPVREGWYAVNVTSSYNAWRAGTGATTRNFGLKLRPYPLPVNNRFTEATSSRGTCPQAPYLRVTYTPGPNDGKLNLKWPLATPRAAPTTCFGCVSPIRCQPAGPNKLHNGTDYSASVGTGVYAAEDGVVKKVKFSSEWGWRVVMEHRSPTGGKYTTVYWHITPSVQVDQFVPKGFPIASVMSLGANTHFHFGIRMGAYSELISDLGAMARDTPCDVYPIFPELFIDPEDTSKVVFQ